MTVPVAKRRVSTGAALVAALLVLVVAGCASRPTGDVLVPVSLPADVDRSVQVLAATTRARAQDDPLAFTAQRADQVNFQSYTFSIPPTHVSGKIEWPSRTPGNPATDVVVTASKPLSESGFKDALRAEIASRPDRHGAVFVFIHGFNTSHPEAVFGAARLAADLRATAGAAVVFSWPSLARVTAYVADRESANYSRDSLERTLNAIASVPDVQSINLVAHSMGTWLTAETLRQASIGGRAPFLKKLDHVVLLSPDIDKDVFKTQLAVIKKTRSPMIVVVSRDDRALATSQILAGGVSRVGNVLVDDPRAQAAISHYGVEVVDLSNLSSSDALGHSKFADVLPELENITAASGGGNRRPLGGPAIFVLGRAGQILSAPARVGDALAEAAAPD